MNDTIDVDRVLTEFENRLDAMSTRVEKLEHQNEWLEDALKERDMQIRDLEQELENIDTRTDLLDNVQEATTMKPDERAGVLIQTLYNEAEKGNGRASMDVGEAVKTLGGGVHRTSMYGEEGDFKRAVELVGDEDVLDLKEENRASDKNTRLRLDLTSGEVPEKSRGVELKGGVSD